MDFLGLCVGNISPPVFPVSSVRLFAYTLSEPGGHYPKTFHNHKTLKVMSTLRMIMQTVHIFDQLQLEKRQEEGIRVRTNLYYLPEPLQSAPPSP